jgi:hypothetical protein
MTDRWRIALVVWTLFALGVGFMQGWGIVTIGVLWLLGLMPLALVRVVVR